MPEYLPPTLPDAGPTGPAISEVAPRGPRIRVALAALVGIAAVAIGGTLLLRSGTGKHDLLPGWKRIEVAAEGFSVDLPPTWRSVSTTSADVAFRQLKDANPELANLVKDQLGGNLSSLIKLLAFDTQSPALAQKFAVNMNVVVAPAPGVSIETFIEQNLGQLRTTPGVANVESRKVELSAGRAGLVKSQLTVTTPSGPQQVAITQYLIVNGTKGYIMSFSTLPPYLESNQPDFVVIAESFRFI